MSLCDLLLILLGLPMCAVLIWCYVPLGSLETLPQVCVPDFDELLISDIDSSYEGLHSV